MPSGRWPALSSTRDERAATPPGRSFSPIGPRSRVVRPCYGGRLAISAQEAMLRLEQTAQLRK
jgi:hypothetical protein